MAQLPLWLIKIFSFPLDGDFKGKKHKIELFMSSIDLVLRNQNLTFSF